MRERVNPAPELECHAGLGELVDIQGLQYALRLQPALSDPHMQPLLSSILKQQSNECHGVMDCVEGTPAQCACGPTARSHHMQWGSVSALTCFGAPLPVYTPRPHSDITRISRQVSACRGHVSWGARRVGG